MRSSRSSSAASETASAVTCTSAPGTTTRPTRADYEDLSLFTADEDIAADVADVFDVIMGRAPVSVFRKLLVGPWFLRGGILDEIERVTRAAAAGRRGRIRIKVNSLADSEIVDALYRASRAGDDRRGRHAGHLHATPRAERDQRPDPRAQRARPIPRAQPDPVVRDRRAVHDVDRQRRPDAAKPRPSDRGARPGRGRWAAAPADGIFAALLADTASSWDLDTSGTWRRARPAVGVPLVSAQKALMTRAAGSGAESASLERRAM